jgi:hypothetical protein
MPDCALPVRPRRIDREPIDSAQPARASRAARGPPGRPEHYQWPIDRGTAPSHSAQSALPARTSQLHAAGGITNYRKTCVRLSR